MARRPSVQEILEAARRGEPVPQKAPEPAQPSPPAPSPAGAVSASTGPRPRLTLQEKLEKARVEREARIAARTGASAARPTQRLSLEEKLERARVEREARAATRNGSASHGPSDEAAATHTAPTPAAPGRRLTLQEKLAAARGGKSTVAAAPPAAAPTTASPAGMMSIKDKIAAARGVAGQPIPQTPAPKPTSAAPVAPPAADRELPPLAELTEPRDLAEALRRSGARKAEEASARPPAPGVVVRPVFDPSAAPARPSITESSMEPPARSVVQIDGRGVLIYASWPVVVGWVAFGMAAGWLLRLLFAGGSS